jgi:hypothetical protein
MFDQTIIDICYWVFELTEILTPRIPGTRELVDWIESLDGYHYPIYASFGDKITTKSEHLEVANNAFRQLYTFRNQFDFHDTSQTLLREGNVFTRWVTGIDYFGDMQERTIYDILFDKRSVADNPNMPEEQFTREMQISNFTNAVKYVVVHLVGKLHQEQYIPAVFLATRKVLILLFDVLFLATDQEIVNAIDEGWDMSMRCLTSPLESFIFKNYRPGEKYLDPSLNINVVFQQRDRYLSATREDVWKILTQRNPDRTFVIKNDKYRQTFVYLSSVYFGKAETRKLIREIVTYIDDPNDVQRLMETKYTVSNEFGVFNGYVLLKKFFPMTKYFLVPNNVFAAISNRI